MSVQFRVGPLPDSGVLHIYAQRDSIDTDPPYQRASDIWTLEKQQLLIDSILNGFDMPKLYFHEFTPMKKMGKKSIKFAIVDGKQRLQAIWSFIENGFALSNDFRYLHDDKVVAKNMTYADLASEYPNLRILFDSKTLPITTIQTDEPDLIEEMFSRLNEAVPLNAAEQRNAWGGALQAAIKSLVKHKFFTEYIRTSGKRYRFHDIVTRFLLIEREDGVTDLKKGYLDEFVRSYKGKPASSVKRIEKQCASVLTAMTRVFTKKDSLLTSVGMVVVYYLLFRDAIDEGWSGRIRRPPFQEFDNARSENRELAKQSLGSAIYDLLEFDRLMQSPNDSVAIEFRLKVLTKFVTERLSGKKASLTRKKMHVAAR